MASKALELAAANTQLQTHLDEARAETRLVRIELTEARKTIAALESAATGNNVGHKSPKTSKDAVKVAEPRWGTHRFTVARLFAERPKKAMNVDDVVAYAKRFNVNIGKCPWKRVGELARLGWIEQVGTTKGDSGVGRTTYRITEEGLAKVEKARERADRKGKS